MNIPGKLVKWDRKLQGQFQQLARQHGPSGAARMLGIHDRQFYDLQRGITRGGGKSKDATTRPRRYVGLELVEKLAVALGDPLVESRKPAGYCRGGKWIQDEAA